MPGPAAATGRVAPIRWPVLAPEAWLAYWQGKLGGDAATAAARIGDGAVPPGWPRLRRQLALDAGLPFPAAAAGRLG